MSNIPYTADEKEFLVQIIKKYPIIENKQTDATNIKKKSEAWERVCEEYNSHNINVKRTILQLKRCWDKIKRQRKSVLAEERRERMRTGCGSTQPDEVIIPDVDTIVPHLSFEIPNPFDSDAAFLIGNENLMSDTLNTEEINTPSTSKEPATGKIVASKFEANYRKKSRQSSFDELMKARLENTNLESDYLKQQHNEKMKLLAVQQEAEIERKRKAEYETEIYKIQLKCEEEKLKHAQIKNEELLLDIEIKKRKLN